MPDLEVRPLREGDVPALTRQFPEGDAAATRRALESDEVTLLLAFLDGVPVGQVQVHWLPKKDEMPVEWHEGVASLEDLQVLPEYQSRGIGTAIIAEAERLAVERGFDRMALGVGVDNPRARGLYERLGYADAGLPVVHDGGVFTDNSGVEHHWQEDWTHMIKTLWAH